MRNKTIPVGGPLSGGYSRCAFLLIVFLSSFASAQRFADRYDEFRLRQSKPENPKVYILIDDYIDTGSETYFTLDSKTFTKLPQIHSMKVLSENSKVHLWGLEITDVDRLLEFLKDRPLDCIQLAQVDDLHILDCIASPVKDYRQIKKVSRIEFIDTYIAFPAFELAEHACNEHEMRFHLIYVYSEFASYRCDDNQVPIRILRAISSQPNKNPY